MDFKIYENKESNGSIILNFRGYEHPIKEEEVIPTIQKILKHTIEKLKEKYSSGSRLVDLNETIGFLEMIEDYTTPTTGYIFYKKEENE